MAIEGATWVVFDSGGVDSPPGYNLSYVVRISGDSTHEDREYKIMRIANLIHSVISRPEEVSPPYRTDDFRYFGLVRDDTINRRFLGIVPIEEGVYSDGEVLIHDFGISVGDPVLGVFKYDASITLDSIVTDSLFGKRRITHVSASNFFAEGIGNLVLGPLCFNPPFVTQMGYQALLSYCIGTEEECGLDIMSDTHGSPRKQINFQVFPNPASANQAITIKVTPIGGKKTLTCSDMSGKILFQLETGVTGVAQILPAKLSAGTYIISYGGVVNKKIVVR